MPLSGSVMPNTCAQKEAAQSKTEGPGTDAPGKPEGFG
jgi:hypothetical protein